MPIILAAHRYGYLAWTDLFRRQNSFYNLPKIKVGDTVEIDWGQRKYTYGVYTTEEGTQITDYSADLILYTCESLTGDERFFVYAHLIQM
jgi:sortase (surface protein transpeptidase)